MIPELFVAVNIETGDYAVAVYSAKREYFDKLNSHKQSGIVWIPDDPYNPVDLSKFAD